MKYFVAILLTVIVFVGANAVHGIELEPAGINVIEYGIFDQNDNITHELVVGQEYKIKTQFESELNAPVTFSYGIQVIDKNKRLDEVVDEFKTESFLQLNDIHHASFGFIPQYAGNFRTFAVFTNVVDGATIGGVPQYDFEVINSDTAIKEKTETEIISDKISDVSSSIIPVNADSIKTTEDLRITDFCQLYSFF